MKQCLSVMRLQFGTWLGRADYYGFSRLRRRFAARFRESYAVRPGERRSA